MNLSHCSVLVEGKNRVSCAQFLRDFMGAGASSVPCSNKRPFEEGIEGLANGPTWAFGAYGWGWSIACHSGGTLMGFPEGILTSAIRWCAFSKRRLSDSR